MENTSGQGKAAIVPPEIKGWNWGAFLLNFIWGIGNDTYRALWMMVPPLCFIMPFMLGAKGNEWAWQNRRWDSIEHFKRIQRGWAKWGVIVIVGYVGFFGVFFGGFFYWFSHTEAYLVSVAELKASAAAIKVLGEPISTGIPFGSISVNGSTGKASLTYSAQGPKDKGMVSVDAAKIAGEWKLNRMRLRLDGSGEVLTVY